jgi:cholesterol transport system auxiliary component
MMLLPINCFKQRGRGLRYIHWLNYIFVGIVLAACSQPPVPKDNYYRLHIGSPKQIYQKPLFSGSVEIQRFSADGLLANRQIAYASSQRPHLLNEYHYHFWSEPPPVMIRDQMVDFLRATKSAERVVTSELRLSAKYIIYGKIKRFEHIRGSKEYTAVELELAARNRKSGDLLYLGTYGVKTPVAGSDVSSAVESINRSVREIFTRFLNNIANKKIK